MAITYTDAADLSTVTASGTAPPYTVEELVAGKTDWNLLVNALDDTAAATAGVPIGTCYRTGSAIKVRVA